MIVRMVRKNKKILYTVKTSASYYVELFKVRIADLDVNPFS